MHCFLNGNLIFRHDHIKPTNKGFTVYIGQKRDGTVENAGTVPEMKVKEAFAFKEFFMKEGFQLLYQTEWIPPKTYKFSIYNLPYTSNVPRNGRD